MSTNDSKEPNRDLTSKSAYVALFFALPVLVVFAYLGKWEMGIGAWICIGLVLLVARTHWDLRGSLWFWVSIAFSVVLQVPFILLVPWNNRSLSGISLLPVAVVDYGIVYGCMKLAEKAGKRSQSQPSVSD